MTRARRASRTTTALAATMLAAGLMSSSCRPVAKVRATDAAGFPALEVGRLVEPGLELVRCHVPADPAALRDGLARLADDGISPLDAGLGREGFVLLAVPNARLRDAIEALGGSPVTRRTALGQPDAWLDLATETIAPGRAYFRGGRPVEGDGSTVHLDLRGWCFPTVDDARARLELRLSEDRGRVHSVSMDPSEFRVRRIALPDATATLELAPGESLVVVAAPLVAESAEDGPAATVPPTLATILLPGSPFPDRVSVLVIAPSFADILPSGVQPAGLPPAPATPESPPGSDGPDDLPAPPDAST
ncbi:MAG: hypothetical protein RIS86_1832 [Planctomycetota bacterium]